MINFTVEINAGLPIYEQVVFAVKKAIVTGQLKAGDPFPSVRELSRELRVNPNTIQKAATSLLRERLLEVHPGIGTRVASLSLASADQRKDVLEIEVEKLVVEAKRLSITKKDLIEAVNNVWAAKWIKEK